MWYRFVLLPWWAHFLVFCLLFGAAVLVPVALLDDIPFPVFLLGFETCFGVFASAALTFGLRRGARLLREPLAGVSPADYSKVAKALTTGPVPSDPAVRRAALLLARKSGEKLGRTRLFTIGLFLVCAVLQAVPTVVLPSSPGITAIRLASLAMFSGLTVYYWLYPKLLWARAQLLAAPEDAPTPLRHGAMYPVAPDPYWSGRAAGPPHDQPR